MTVWREQIAAYAAAHREELLQLTEELCRIPAPSGGERARAEFCKRWLGEHGAGAVRIDAADNAVLELCKEEDRALTVLMAHTDTVFPDTGPMAVRREDGQMLCPGVCDDTANLAVLLLAARFLLEHKICPAGGMLIVADSGEEGLGNLRGCRQLMADYQGRVARVISFDGYYTALWDRAVGSARYEITVCTEGGHSFRDFGRDNAIAVLSRLISDLYELTPPQEPAGSTTTYNVGVIRGGTSVNTIAQEASAFYEYRSDDVEGLRAIEEMFRAVIRKWQERGVDVQLRTIGLRPCAEGVDPAAQQSLEDIALEILQTCTGMEPMRESASTDCNIPLSMGIPAVCFGLCNGGGAHTREEWLEEASLETGLRVALETVLRFVK